ncbi:hypothetical protein KVR01_008084 [Diaporthe batatas]|uniref:uncharacterized protein n=1 Tax=Diaporthe batatas TaxID=748121 RepID=UPI001D03654E|nr:uncharacterized protein KVR01_008084 [Diaporthe batatas]KAG8162319.1 hypothetical protein KVR01_008084 [Diaporthe batatas]
MSYCKVTTGNWLDTDRIPNEIKLIILEHVLEPKTLGCLAKAYEWVEPLWNRYPTLLFPPALEHLMSLIHPEAPVRGRIIMVYLIRTTRNRHRAAVGDRPETQAETDRLQAKLLRILEIGREGLQEHYIRPALQAILDIAAVAGDLARVTDRYSNDAWKRVHQIAAAVDRRHNKYEDLSTPPPVELDPAETRRFFRSFLAAEIYLLTKFWTTKRGQRHVFDMGGNVDHFLPRPYDTNRAGQFESCLRFMFDAHRGYLKEAARGLGAPELPPRDDLQWVPSKREVRDYAYEDYDTTVKDDAGRPGADFAHRSVSEEQRFLLWQCEGGMEAISQSEQRPSAQRRAELLGAFSTLRPAWDTVELRHRACRYDTVQDVPRALVQYYGARMVYSPERNRHPVGSLYPAGTQLRYPEATAPWACAALMLAWEVSHGGPGAVTMGLVRRQGLTIGWHTRWLMHCDTDRNRGDRVPHIREGPDGVYYVPFGHLYLLDPVQYELRLWSGLDMATRRS